MNTKKSQASLDTNNAVNREESQKHTDEEILSCLVNIDKNLADLSKSVTGQSSNKAENSLRENFVKTFTDIFGKTETKKEESPVWKGLEAKVPDVNNVNKEEPLDAIIQEESTRENAEINKLISSIDELVKKLDGMLNKSVEKLPDNDSVEAPILPTTENKTQEVVDKISPESEQTKALPVVGQSVQMSEVASEEKMVAAATGGEFKFPEGKTMLVGEEGPEIIRSDPSNPTGPIQIFDNPKTEKILSHIGGDRETKDLDKLYPQEKHAGGTGVVSQMFAMPTIASAGGGGPDETFKSLSLSIGAMLPEMFGPVGLALTALGDAVMGAVEGFNKLSESLQKYSPEITSAMVEVEVYKINKDIQKANIGGDDLGKLYEESGKAWEDVRMFLFDIGKPFIEYFTDITRTFRSFIQYITPMMTFQAENVAALTSALFSFLTGAGIEDCINLFVTKAIAAWKKYKDGETVPLSNNIMRNFAGLERGALSGLRGALP